ncbi:MAG: hypothetical protein HY291_17700 [Planctomycetes bacterium]|nr:hypothetical protein [Planctomycetota bacterium]
MSRLRIVMCVAAVMLCAGSAWSMEWGAEFPEARAALLKIFTNHQKFRAAMTDWLADHPKMAKRMVKFLVEKDSHSIEEFIKAEDRKDKDLPFLQKTWEDHHEGMLAFCEWVQHFPKAAEALVDHPAVIKHLDDVSERRERKEK